MTQLILDNRIYLPETSWDKYQCYPVELGTEAEMISGREVKEIRGIVQMISYSYDYMGNNLMRQVNEILRSGKSFRVTYLPDDGDEMRSGYFHTKTFPTPGYAFSRGGVPYWHNVSFTLREVAP